MGEIQIRQMREADIASAMILKNAESWNQTEADWHFFLDQNPELCLVASLPNEVIGTVTAIKYDKRIAWIGMMLVSRNHRRKGVSLKLLHSIIDRLSDCDWVGLDATPVGARVYRKLGFIEEHGVIRMSTQGMVATAIESLEGIIKTIEASDILEVSRLDEAAFGGNRTDLISYLSRNALGLGWTLRRDGAMTGFILGRKGNRFTHLGPIVAESIEDAKALFARASKSLAGTPLVVDVLAVQSDWLAWLQAVGFSNQRSFYRMYLVRNRSGMENDTQYAICGPEFG